MLFNIIPIILIFAALAVIIMVILRRLPEITAINTDTIPEVKAAEVKRQLLVSRLERKLRSAVNALWSGTASWRSGAREWASLIYQKLSSLEEYYRQGSLLKSGDFSGADNAVALDGVSLMVKEADKKREEGLWIEAERIYLEAIKHDHKLIGAYLGLGLLYRSQRQYKDAIEALTYARKLNDSANVAALLGEAYIEAGRPREALPIFKVISKAEPSNERYLDRLLETAILLGKKKLAVAALSALAEINPQYHRLVELKQRVNAIPEKRDDKR